MQLLSEQQSDFEKFTRGLLTQYADKIQDDESADFALNKISNELESYFKEIKRNIERKFLDEHQQKSFPKELLEKYLEKTKVRAESYKLEMENMVQTEIQQRKSDLAKTNGVKEISKLIQELLNDLQNDQHLKSMAPKELKEHAGNKFEEVWRNIIEDMKKMHKLDELQHNLWKDMVKTYENHIFLPRNLFGTSPPHTQGN